MVVVVQLAERQIVALEVKGSIPFDHPRIKNRFTCDPYMMGCRQVVRHWPLTPTCVGSNPATPAKNFFRLWLETFQRKVKKVLSKKITDQTKMLKHFVGALVRRGCFEVYFFVEKALLILNYKVEVFGRLRKKQSHKCGSLAQLCPKNLTIFREPGKIVRGIKSI